MGFLLELFTAENLIALVTLTGLEVVLGVDNIVFIVIVAEKLPEEKQAFGRKLGLILAMLLRIALLFAVSWLIKLNEPIFTLFKQGVSVHALVLLVGGLFLIAKATYEIHAQLSELTDLRRSGDEDGEGKPPVDPDLKASHDASTKGRTSFWMVIAQILALDLIFSIDSVITAVGMVESKVVIVVAVMVAVAVMMAFAEGINNFVSKNPTIKMLALAFLILIGVTLAMEAFHEMNHANPKLPKGYIYSAMGFSLVVELVNLKVIKGIQLKRVQQKRQRRRIADGDNPNKPT